MLWITSSAVPQFCIRPRSVVHGIIRDIYQILITWRCSFHTDNNSFRVSSPICTQLNNELRNAFIGLHGVAQHECAAC